MQAMTVILPVSSVGMICIGIVLGYIVGRATK